MYEKSKSLDRYFKSIHKLNPLEKREELELARKCKSGDIRSRNKLIEHNLKIVVTIANKNIGRGIPIDDLIQQGNLGLYEASLRFDPDNNVRFASYAGTWVLKYINQLIDQCGRIVRIPVNQEIQRYEAIKRGDTIENLSSIDIDERVSDDNETRKSDLIFSVTPDIYDKLEDDYTKKTVKLLLESLNGRERQVIEMYYGVNLEDEIKAKDIASELGITQIRVYQILNTVKNNLRSKICN